MINLLKSRAGQEFLLQLREGSFELNHLSIDIPLSMEGAADSTEILYILEFEVGATL